MLWHEKSWLAIRDMDKMTPVVLPLGSIEQHGHHLPVNVDTVQVDTIARRAEVELGGSALFLPTFWLGCSHHHLDFPGTISLLPSLYSQVLKGIVECILNAGFRRIFLLNGHGGNQTPMAQALTELVAQNELADEAHLAAASWWQVGREAIAPGRHGLHTPFLTHACEYETSLMLAIRPDLVHLAEATDARPVLQNEWTSYEFGGRVALFKRFHRLTDTGSMGQPTQATAEKGQSLLDAVSGDVVRFLRDFATWPFPPKLKH